MNTSELADRLVELTASWQPSGAATQQDLRDARLYLADGFLSGIAPQQFQLTPTFRTSVMAFTRPEIDAAARLAKSSTNLMPYVRSTGDSVMNSLHIFRVPALMQALSNLAVNETPLLY